MHRGLSLDKALSRLSELVNGISKASLSRLENNKQVYTQDILEAMAEVYRCEPQDILMRDPTKKDAPWNIQEGLKPVQREALEKIAEGVQELLKPPGTGTDG